MKNHIIYPVLCVWALFGMTSCNDSFLDLSPKGAITDATAFTSFESCSDYVASLYDVFNGYTLFQGPAPVSGALGTSTRDTWSGLLTNYASGWGTIPNAYANQTVTVPVSSSTYTLPYRWIRQANILLAHIEEPKVTDAQRKYLEAVARFFRAYCHYALLVNYGDCIYADRLLTESSEELYKSRDSRLMVADRIHSELT